MADASSPAAAGLGSKTPVLVARRGDFVEEYVLAEVSTIGRSPESSVWLHDPLVSGQHAEIHRLEDGEYQIIDLQSSHGTYVNKRPVQRFILRDGDEIFIGATQLRFLLKDAPQQQGRRHHSRVPCHLAVRVEIDGEHFDTFISDLSVGGLRLDWSEKPVRINSQIVLRIAFPRRWRRMTVPARVCWCDEQSLGVSFIFPSSQQENAIAAEYARLYLVVIGEAASGDEPSGKQP